MTTHPTSEKMQTVVRHRFGPPDVVEIVQLDRPVPDDDQVLVRVRASSLNRADWYGLRGRPWVGRLAMGLRRPKSPQLGTDYAGEVVTVGKNVTGFRPGDRVFGGRDGSLAEFVAARHDRGIVHMPADTTFEQAAAVPVAALTALQGLRDRGGVQAGHRVLIQGASGGVGTFAVQIAKALGAEVTAVCGPRGVAAARAGGADHVVDYTREDFTKTDRRYDLVFDIAGTRPFRHLKRVLTRQGVVVMVGGPKDSRLLGPIGHLISLRLGGLLGRRKVGFFMAKVDKAGMETLRDLLAAGKVKPVIDRTFALKDTAEAFRYMENGHPQGKVVIKVG